LDVWWQAPGTVEQVEGTCGAAKPVDLNYLRPTDSRGPGVYLHWAWASRSHGSCCRHSRTSLWPVEVLGPNFLQRLQGCSSVVLLQGAKPLGSRNSVAQFPTQCSPMVLLLTQENKVCGQGSSGAQFPAQVSGSSNLLCCCCGN
jgi:hypothetical protein